MLCYAHKFCVVIVLRGGGYCADDGRLATVLLGSRWIHSKRLYEREKVELLSKFKTTHFYYSACS